MSQIKVKSKAGDSKAFVWVMLDQGGKLQAVCYAAKSASEALTPGFMNTAAKHARASFMRAGAVRKTGLVDLGGSPITAAQG